MRHGLCGQTSAIGYDESGSSYRRHVVLCNRAHATPARNIIQITMHDSCIVHHSLSHKTEVNVTRYIQWFKDLGMNDVAVVGGKNASLGEMIANLANAGISVPDGFATTATFVPDRDDRRQSD